MRWQQAMRLLFFSLLPSLSSCALPPVLPHPPPSKCGKLLTGVNGIIAQGNNQQMEYAKWRRDRRQRRRETDRDRSRRIFLLKSGSDVVPPNWGRQRRRHGRVLKTVRGCSNDAVSRAGPGISVHHLTSGQHWPILGSGPKMDHRRVFARLQMGQSHFLKCRKKQEYLTSSLTLCCFYDSAATSSWLNDLPSSNISMLYDTL